MRSKFNFTFGKIRKAKRKLSAAVRLNVFQRHAGALASRALKIKPSLPRLPPDTKQ